MRKIVFGIAIVIALLLVIKVFLFSPPGKPFAEQILWIFLSIFFLFFGMYGLFAEWLYGKLRSGGKNQNLCIEASYFIQRRGTLMKVLFFPFLKVKSSNSFVVSFFGALAWVIISMIIFQTIAKITS